MNVRHDGSILIYNLNNGVVSLDLTSSEWLSFGDSKSADEAQTDTTLTN
jgi:hypothetical protein